MSRLFPAVVWILFAVTLYLLLEEVVSPWLTLPALGNIGFTLVFVLFSVLHCACCEGRRRAIFFFFLTAIISYALEETGVRTGLVYGPYHYSNKLGPMLGDVPVLIPLAWFMMIYPSWVTARALLRGLRLDTTAGILALAMVAAMVMTAWDTVMDPGMAAAGNWVWEQGGSYFGVPLQNYFGWLLTTFLVYCGAGVLWRVVPKPPVRAGSVLFATLPVILYTMHGVRYVTAVRIPELHVVALFAMVLPGLIALLQIWMPRRSELI